ncbi:hypothetical protein C8Q74DRAFT_1373059 [Fomes fomentarius]|nr:hypothetical protein C8Q74DRAFT_1373059 [Fomes fomentarius]
MRGALYEAWRIHATFIPPLAYFTADYPATMNQSDSSVNPVQHPLYNDTAAFSPLLVGEYCLWCTSGGLPHWISAHAFAQPVISSTPRPSDPTQIRPSSSTERPKPGEAKWGGVSLDMFQPLNHVYHSIPDDTKSGNVFGALRINARHADALMSSRAPIYARATFLVTVTVQDIVDLIISQGRQYYQFDPAGSGCLFWQLALLEQYVAKGWISSEDFARIKQEVQQFAASPTGVKVPYPPVAGTFYKPPQ